MFKERPNIVLNPNLPDRGVKVDRSWMQAGMSPEEFAKLERKTSTCRRFNNSTASRRAISPR